MKETTHEAIKVAMGLLVEQVEKSDFRDENDHPLAMNVGYIGVKALAETMKNPVSRPEESPLVLAAKLAFCAATCGDFCNSMGCRDEVEFRKVLCAHLPSHPIDGAERIRLERERQKTVEGWTLKHDDEHDGMELAQAAVCYAMPPKREPLDYRAQFWPDSWSPEWFKPSKENRIRELEKAGALIAAEIDRMERLNSRGAIRGQGE